MRINSQNELDQAAANGRKTHVGLRMTEDGTKASRFFKAYVASALWSSTDDDGEPLDSRFDESDLSPETHAAMLADCAAFYAANFEHIRMGWPAFEDEDAQAGHDFWLTRCGHGAGFWDGDWPEPHATHLNDVSTAFGNVDLYIGDDGKIHA